MTKDELLENFDFVDNNFYWKKPRSGIKVGQKAGSIEKKGYLRIKFNCKKYLVHRLVFLYHHGYMPQFVDHINNDPSDNRIENLREATFAQNKFNTKRQKNNTSGIKNVHWSKKYNRWLVTMSINKKLKYFGCYKDLELAGLVAMELRNKYHKEFAQHF
jgi:hypothetical protein